MLLLENYGLSKDSSVSDSRFVFSTPNFDHQLQRSADGNPHEITVVPNYEYLGVIMDEFLKFDVCTKTLASAGGRALGSIISKFRNLKGVGYETFLKLYENKVKPILEYGSGIWG